MLQRILKHYWVEILLLPPFVVWLCSYLYGDIYFQSWRNFGLISLPWLFNSIVSPIGCHWVRDAALRRYHTLEQWPQRVGIALLGYLVCTVGLAKFTYFLLEVSHYGGLQPDLHKFYGLLIVASMCVLTIAAVYEGVIYFNKWKDALTETEQLEQLYLESQFQSLQSQLNPHFLFNGLNVLSSLIRESPRRAEDFVDELSNVYRYLLRSNERELATVNEELRFIKSYFHLLKTRHDEGISMHIDVDPEDLEKKVPALALQILVENAVKHNEVSPENPLHIEIFSEDCAPPAQARPQDGADNRQLTVRNNLQRKPVRAATSNGVGLDNLSRRYSLLGTQGFAAGAHHQVYAVALPLLP